MSNSLLYMGIDNIDTLYIGSQQIDALYLGSEQIYSQGPFVGLKVTKELVFNINQLTGTLKIKSSESWSLTDDSGGWLSYSQSTGDTGETLVTVSATATQSARTATITITTANFSATTDVEQTLIEFVDYVYVDARDNVNTYIDTGIYPTTSTKFRLKYHTIEGNGGVIVGYARTETPIHASSDKTSYRYFNHLGAQSCTWDFNSSRLNPSSLITEQNNVADVTVGNNYVVNNYTGDIAGATEQSSILSPNIPIYLNLTNRSRIQSLEIYEGQTLVFNGHAALKDSVYGIWDYVTETMLQPYNQVYTVLGGYFE